MPKKLDIDTQNINPLLANCLTLLRSLLDALHGHQRISRLSNTADPEAYSLISYPLSPHSHFPFCRVDISASAPGGQQPEHGNLTLACFLARPQSSLLHNRHQCTLFLKREQRGAGQLRAHACVLLSLALLTLLVCWHTRSSPPMTELEDYMRRVGDVGGNLSLRGG